VVEDPVLFRAISNKVDEILLGNFSRLSGDCFGRFSHSQ
jgi:hypothetical protein